ncbi:GNAT family N-acetyltransferase [Thalassotalea sp. M1531]|uniref:GNAT family N-acetyltransferase n=1 Tax=Thalassotalea algicola TaxID=2716224 RepID=A0A7Y0LDJ2_9GAMM|nr:GNAT family N-acetyltransferase [Thalassotalea algicola]NMP32574.1 GNAT family N-acetyltransferase [Thalassotalea algicola]
MQFNYVKTHDKKQVKAFYKAQGYSAGLKGYDHLFVVMDNQQVIACAIVSLIESNSTQALLHGVVVDKNYLRQNIATKLINFAANQLPRQVVQLVCFSHVKLKHLYLKSHFVEAKCNELINTLDSRFKAYQSKQPELAVFRRSLT